MLSVRHLLAVGPQQPDFHGRAVDGPGPAVERRSRQGVAESSTIIRRHQLIEWRSFDEFLVVAQQPGERAGGGQHRADRAEQHRHGGAVVEQRPELRCLVAGELPPATFGDVAEAQQRAVSQRGAVDFGEPPTIGATDPDLEEGADVLVLHADQREGCELQVVGVYEFQPTPAAGLLEGHAEELLGRPVAPQDLDRGVDQEGGIRQQSGDQRGQPEPASGRAGVEVGTRICMVVDTMVVRVEIVQMTGRTSSTAKIAGSSKWSEICRTR